MINCLTLKSTRMFTLLALMLAVKTNAQLSNSGTITIAAGAEIVCMGSLDNNGTLVNNGNLRLFGPVNNNTAVTNNIGSSVSFEGSASQSVSGNPFAVWNTFLNNPAGVVLNTDLSLQGVLTFNSGRINTGTNMVIFSATSSSFGASGLSYVNGKARFDGTGNFIYPVGDNTSYQPITANLSANASGLTVTYVAGDAGTGTFSTAGTSTTPIVSYNKKEYWSINPVGVATGTITLNWDGYNDAYGNAVSQRTIARKSNTSWLNEGNGSPTGTTGAGSVTSNNISSWGAFALGSTGTVLPVRWITVNGQLNNNRRAEINWEVVESNVDHYIVERSTDAIQFSASGTINSKGAGNHRYQFTDAVVAGDVFYRVKQMAVTGETSFSPVIRLAGQARQRQVIVYPSWVHNTATLSVTSNTTQEVSYSIIDGEGKTLSLNHVTLNAGSNVFKLATDQLAAGTYRLLVNDGKTVTVATFVKL